MQHIPKYQVIDNANPLTCSSRRSSIRVVVTAILSQNAPVHLNSLGQLTVYTTSWIKNLTRQLINVPHLWEADGWYGCDNPGDMLWGSETTDPQDVRLYEKIQIDVEKRKLLQERQRETESETASVFQVDDERGDFEEYQHLVDEVYNPTTVDRPIRTVVPAVVQLIKHLGPGAETRLRERFAHCVQEVTDIREDYVLLKRLSDNNDISYDTPNPFLDAHQKRMDEAIGAFVGIISEQTGYQPPIVRCTCPICLDTVREAVCLDCGHLACQECLTDPLIARHQDMVKCPLCSKMGRWRKLYPA